MSTKTGATFDELLAIMAAVVLMLGLVSRLLKRYFLTSVLLATAVGVAIGPYALGWIDFADSRSERHALEHVARLTLAIGVMGIGLQLQREDLRRIARPAALLLTLGMVGMWLVTSAGAWLILGLPLWGAFALGAVLTPTDPVVASTITRGPMAERTLPRSLRRTLQLEAGANDGLALPLVLLAALALVHPFADALAKWALDSAVKLLVAIVVGAILGYATARITHAAVSRAEVERANLLGVGLALAILTLALVHILGGSGILAVFVAALTFSLAMEDHVRDQIEHAQETIIEFFVLPSFVLFGATLPLDAWLRLGLPGAVFALWVLMLRRPPVVAATLALARPAKQDVAFLAWFGPLGVAAIYYVTWIERFDLPQYELIFTAATLAIAASIVAHALTATPAVRWYSRIVGTEDPAEAGREDKPDSDN